jgi:hypothetical protein
LPRHASSHHHPRRPPARNTRGCPRHDLGPRLKGIDAGRTGGGLAGLLLRASQSGNSLPINVATRCGSSARLVAACRRDEEAAGRIMRGGKGKRYFSNGGDSRRGLDGAHIHLALNVPVEEPSTASIADPVSTTSLAPCETLPIRLRRGSEQAKEAATHRLL